MENRLINLLRTYCTLALGRHIQFCVNLNEHGLLLLSGWTKAASWNHMIPTLGPIPSPSDVISYSEEVFKSIYRIPSFYVFGIDNHLPFASWLTHLGYKNIDTEIWLTKDLAAGKASEKVTPYETKVVDSKNLNQVKTFVSGFQQCFGNLPIGYSRQLYLSIISHTNAENFHVYVSTNSQKVIAIGSVYVGYDYAGIFNVAVAPKYRQLGIGATVVSFLEKLALTSESGHTFVQADSFSSPFYLRLGYERVGEAKLFRKEHITK